ncbi:MAG: DUF5615 family PIN-like protein [Spirulinaceae cyanobacterium RM2_2_10]|nr:DUF5615 family PIN-like protein [Spirulinaceae cyanobacterium SM2_1_0]NJO20813.1 DUF5615 family PIN-like protein [Spirulinaceae cyanobacterium RM2_2_10]
MKFLADENLNSAIVRGLLRRSAEVDILRVQDVGLSGADDPTILAWAAAEARILLTHDVATMTRYAYERVANHLPMAGVIEVNVEAAAGRIINDLMIIVECGNATDFDGQIYYLPF